MEQLSNSQIYIYPQYLPKFHFLSQELKNIFFQRCQNVENLLSLDNEILPPESFPSDQEVVPDEIKLKLQKEIGKYVLSDLMSFNKLSDEVITKLFQFEVETLIQLKTLIDHNHYDILMLEDLLFISRMLDLSINLDESFMVSNAQDLAKFMEESQKESQAPQLSKNEIDDYISQLIQNFVAHTQLSIELEFEERLATAKSVLSKLHAQDDENYQRYLSSADSAAHEIKAIYKNALGYSQIYGVPLRVLKNILLMISVNLLQANLEHGISSSEEANLFSNL